MFVASGPGLTYPSARLSIRRAAIAAAARVHFMGSAELHVMRGKRLVLVATIAADGRVSRVGS